MKTMAKIIAVLFVVAFCLVARPVPKATETNCFTISGVIEDVASYCCQDLCFRMAGDPTVYYINRGLERGLVVQDMRDALVDRNASFRIVKHWTLLDPSNNGRTVAEIKIDGDILFSDIRG